MDWQQWLGLWALGRPRPKFKSWLAAVSLCDRAKVLTSLNLFPPCELGMCMPTSQCPGLVQSLALHWCPPSYQGRSDNLVHPMMVRNGETEVQAGRGTAPGHTAGWWHKLGYNLPFQVP